MHKIVVAPLVLLVLALSPHVFADEAKRAFKEGNKLFNKGAYEAASDQYRKANELQPNWKLYYNIGQAEAAAKRPGLALQAFEKYLALGGDDVPAKRHREVSGEVERLRGQIGLLEILAPDGAVVFIDDVDRGTAPLSGQIPVAASVDHTVRLEMEGDAPAPRVVSVLGGQIARVDLMPLAEPPPPEKAVSKEEPAPAPPPRSYRSMKNLGWTGVVTGAALLVAGGVTGAMTAAKSSELESNCGADNICTGDTDKELASSIDSLALVTDILLPVGGVLAVTGTILLIVAHNKERADTVHVTPAVGPGMAGVAVGGRF